MSKFYSGKFTPRNPHKYKGDHTKIFFRSSWELSTFNWLDKNSGVKSWCSEETVIPYVCPTDKRNHRYFLDLKITFANGKTFLVEIKPEAQTRRPQPKKKVTKNYIREILTYEKNEAKWEAAKEYAELNGYTFAIWTEKTLKCLGVPII